MALEARIVRTQPSKCTSWPIKSMVLRYSALTEAYFIIFVLPIQLE